MRLADRLFAAAGGLCGAAGVALAATASHGQSPLLGIAAGFLIAHAPVFLMLGLRSAAKWFQRAGILLAVGLVIFCSDLAVRHFGGARLFPSAAPLGGLLTIAGWLGFSFAALIEKSRS